MRGLGLWSGSWGNRIQGVGKSSWQAGHSPAPDWFGLHPVLPTSVCFYNFESKCYICSIHFSRSDDMVEVCGALLHFCSGEMWPVMYFLCNTLVRVWLRAVMASVLFSRRV